MKLASEALHVHADSVHGNLPWPQNLGLSGARFKRVSICYTTRQDHCIKEILDLSIVKLDISKFISFGIPEGDNVQEQTSHYRSLV